ncbi:hypothetical protein [Liberiplasma polymorphum]|uniref:hypothetical protein n=1 Tax=Liberiplasma polymorphum TaxID=3374570 RepID=UPI0037731EFC
MSKEQNLKTWIESFNKGEYDSKDLQTQIKAGWYDWFCKDESLANKTKRMGNIVKQFKDSGKLNLDKTYVWFKNNCPLAGPLYDDFRIADIQSGDTLFTITINCFREEKRYTVYGRKNDFTEPLFETDKSRELINWFNEGWSDNV